MKDGKEIAMQKLLSYTLDDLRFDPEAIAGVINQACARRRYRLSGVCQTADRVFFVLIPHDLTGREDYVIVPVEDPEEAAMTGALADRWIHGFHAIGLIRLEERSLLVVYAREGGKDTRHKA